MKPQVFDTWQDAYNWCKQSWAGYADYDIRLTDELIQSLSEGKAIAVYGEYGVIIMKEEKQDQNFTSTGENATEVDTSHNGES